MVNILDEKILFKEKQIARIEARDNITLLNDFVVESSDIGGVAVWMMPNSDGSFDVEKLRRLRGEFDRERKINLVERMNDR